MASSSLRTLDRTVASYQILPATAFASNPDLDPLNGTQYFGGRKDGHNWIYRVRQDPAKPGQDRFWKYDGLPAFLTGTLPAGHPANGTLVAGIAQGALDFWASDGVRFLKPIPGMGGILGQYAVKDLGTAGNIAPSGQPWRVPAVIWTFLPGLSSISGGSTSVGWNVVSQATQGGSAPGPVQLPSRTLTIGQETATTTEFKAYWEFSSTITSSVDGLIAGGEVSTTLTVGGSLTQSERESFFKSDAQTFPAEYFMAEPGETITRWQYRVTINGKTIFGGKTVVSGFLPKTTKNEVPGGFRWVPKKTIQPVMK